MSNVPVPYHPALASGAKRKYDLPLGTADWFKFSNGATPHFKRGDLFLGRTPDGHAVGYGDDRHALLVAGTRGGKGTSVIVPTLTQWPGSTVVIDPKGENAMVTARRRSNGSPFCRGMGQKVRILDPFGIVQTKYDTFEDLKVSFNPLDLLTVDREESVDEAARMAESFMISEASNDPFWEEAARDLIRDVTLHVASAPDFLPEQRNLVTVRRLLAAGDAEMKRLAAMGADVEGLSGFDFLFHAMKRNHAWGGVVANAGEWFAKLERDSSRLFGSIVQVALTNTSFIASPPMQRCLAKSDFSLNELKTDPLGTSLFLCLPQRYGDVHSRWLRMMTAVTLSEMERNRARPASGHSILMILDEFASLKRMRSIENAAAQIAGFGVKMMFVVQTLAQLKEIYKDNWETIIANCGVKLFFGNDDHFTRDYVSKLMGETEVVRVAESASRMKGSSHSVTIGSGYSVAIGTSDGSSSTSSFGGGSATGSGMSISNSVNSGRSRTETFSVSRSETFGTSESDTRGWSESIHKRPLAAPDEIGRIFGDRTQPRTLVLASGEQPLALKRVFYFSDTMFLGTFDYHPDHPAPLRLPAVRAWEAQEAQRRKEESERAARSWVRMLDEEARKQREEQIAIAQHHLVEVFSDNPIIWGVWIVTVVPSGFAMIWAALWLFGS